MHTFDAYTAVAVAEGWEDPKGETPEERLEYTLAAWQYLHDTRIGYGLQGWFGRTLHALRNQGLIVDNTGVDHAEQ
jgi:hypothetical protein